MPAGRRYLLFILLGLVFGILISLVNDAEGKDQGMDIERGLDELSRELIDHLPPSNHISIAVADFWDLQGGISGLGRYVAEEISTRIFKIQGKFRVIESGLLDQILDELCINQTDLFDKETTKRLGRFIGADAMLVGTISDLDMNIRVNARIISTERRETLSAASITIAKDSRVTKLLGINLKPQVQFKAGCKKSSDSSINERIEGGPGADIELFENHLIRMTVKSLTWERGSLILEIWYENMIGQTMTIYSKNWWKGYAAGTYLLSEGAIDGYLAMIPRW